LSKYRITPEEIKCGMSLHTDNGGRNAWHIAAYGGKLDVIQKILYLVKKRITTDEIKMKYC